MSDIKPYKGKFGEPWERTETGINGADGQCIYWEDGWEGGWAEHYEEITLDRAIESVNALDGRVPDEIVNLIGDSHRALVALLAPEPGGADLRFQAYKHLKATLRAFAPDMFRETPNV